MVPWLGLSRGKAPVNVLAQNFARTQVFLPRGSDGLGLAQTHPDFSDCSPPGLGSPCPPPPCSATPPTAPSGPKVPAGLWIPDRHSQLPPRTAPRVPRSLGPSKLVRREAAPRSRAGRVPLPREPWTKPFSSCTCHLCPHLLAPRASGGGFAGTSLPQDRR